MFKSKKTSEKPQRKRSMEETLSQIYRILQITDHPLTTSQVAIQVKLEFSSAMSHLKFLEFSDKIIHFERGSGSWLYWKIKR